MAAASYSLSSSLGTELYCYIITKKTFHVNCYLKKNYTANSVNHSSYFCLFVCLLFFFVLFFIFEIKVRINAISNVGS